MHWILELPPDRLDLTEQDYSQIRLSKILEEKNLPFSFHKVVPIAGELIPGVEANKNAICIGPYSMRNYAKRQGIIPGVYDIEDMNFLVQKKHWGEQMLNSESKVITFKELTAISLIDDKEYFVRPINDSKVFAGGIFTGKELLSWHEKVVVLEDDYGDTLTGNTIIQVMRPLQILREYRNWIIDGEIITSSLYKKGDKVTYSNQVPEDVIAYVKECISIWQPHKAFVIDVCVIETVDNKIDFRIVEINTINAAGFYHADLNKLVDAFEKLESK